MTRTALPLALAVLLVSAACASKKGSFNPEPVIPPAPASSASAGGAQPIGGEGFKENSVNANDAGTGGVREITGDHITEAEVAAALKTVYFGYDSDELAGDAMQILSADAAWIKQHPQVKIQIEGHCDQRGTIEYNMALGARRARAVKEQMVRLGVPADRLDTISYGKERPAAEGDGEAVWAKNRRAEFRMLP